MRLMAPMCRAWVPPGLVYFREPASQLTLPEALTLAVIPQDPSRRLQAGRGTNNALISNGLADARNRLYQAWLVAHPHDASLKPLLRFRSRSSHLVACLSRPLMPSNRC